MSIASITRIVKFIRMGERGNSVITAVAPIRRFTLALWQKIGSNDYSYSWANISNAADYKAGDTIVINGVVTDKDDVSIMYYGKVVSTRPNTNTVTALGQTIIISGTNGSSFMAQYSKDGSTDWHATFTDGDIYMRTSADSGKTWSNAIRIVGEKGDETNYAFAWSSHKTLEDGEDPLSDIVDWYDYPPKQPDGKPYLWVMITTPDNKVSYARLTGERGAVMRGPQAWSDCAVGYNFQSGADGEEFKDVVMYGNNYYSCIKSHTKTASNNPTSTIDTNNGYWKLADKFEIVATKILLAQYALVKNLGVEAIDMKDSAGNIIFQAKDGNVICNSGTFNSIKVTGDSEFSGTMKGVSGSFKSLNCVDSNGNIVGNITFGSDGKMWFDGDMYSQGYNDKQKRSNRFYTSDVWCRGMFGHYAKTMAVVKGGYMNVYTKGTEQSGVYVSLKTGKTTNNKTFYYIPLYSPGNGDTSGMPIDVVVFNTASDNYYAFSDMGNGKEWRVINGNDKQTVHFCDIGGWHELAGGHSVNCMYVNPDWLNPVPGTSDIARGVFWTGETDLNW